MMLYLAFAFVAFLLVATGPPQASWRATVVRLAGMFAFPLAFVWLLLPWGFRITAHGRPGISQSEVHWDGMANAVFAFGTFAMFVVTLGLGFLCLSFSQTMNQDAVTEADA